MKKITYLSIFFLFIFLSCLDTGLLAQQTSTMGFGVQYARPTGQLQNKGYRDEFGVSMNLLSRPRFTHPVIGLQYGAQFDLACSEMNRDPLLMPSPDTGELSEMSVENMQAGLHGVARVLTTDRLPVQLYADGMLGSRLFLGQESFAHVDETYDCPEVNTLQKDLVLSYGGSLGALVRLGPFGSLDLRATYLSSGGPAEFIDLTSVSQTEAGSYGYRLQRAPASQLRFQLGINMPLAGMCGGW
jgi:hypothetical protein